MKHSSTTNLTPHDSFNKASVVIALSFILGTVTYAWTGAPAGIPPANNVDAPVNVGVGTQYKSGSLGIGGLLKVYGTFNVETGAGLGKVLTSDATGNASWQAPVSPSESDPTVPAYVKDGTDWSEVTNKPTQTSGSIVGGCSSLSFSSLTYSCFGGASWTIYYGTEPGSYVPVCPSGSYSFRGINQEPPTYDQAPSFLCINKI